MYSGQVNDVLLLEDQLWIASEQGLILRSFKQNRDQPEPLPFILRHSPIQHLTVDNGGGYGESQTISFGLIILIRSITRILVTIGCWIISKI